MKQNLFYFLFLISVNLFYYALNTVASPIINGIPDEHHIFKFHVSLHRKHGPGNEYEAFCGGSIISERYILTAAHCFITIVNGVIREIFYTSKIIAGTNLRNGPGIERDVNRVFVPSGPGGRSYPVDLAVAELSVDLGVNQNPDRLAIVPLEALDPHSNAGVNQRATFCGFGDDILEQQHNGLLGPASSGNTINRFMNVRILGRSESLFFEKWISVKSSDLRPFRTACYGDSGSGLLYSNKIVGVLSNGPPDCNTLEPIEFTRLHGYMRFIEEAQNPRGDHSSMHVLDESSSSAPGQNP